MQVTRKLSLRGSAQLNLPQDVNHLLNVAALATGSANRGLNDLGRAWPRQLEFLKLLLLQRVAPLARKHVAQSEIRPAQIQFPNDGCRLNSITK